MDAGKEGVAMIYYFFWGDRSVMALLLFGNQHASFTLARDISEIAPEIINAANSTLQSAYDIISAQYENED
jgi:hypothetical protein